VQTHPEDQPNAQAVPGPRFQGLPQALLTLVSPPPAVPMLTVDQLAIERCVPALRDMREILTLAALRIPAPSTLAEQMPAVKGVETGPSASVPMATLETRLFAVMLTPAPRVLVEPMLTASRTATEPCASVGKAMRATHLSTVV